MIDKNVARRARFNLFGSMLNTYGYAIIAATIIQPYLSVTPPVFTRSRVFGILHALAFQGAAIYIAPRGEKS
jgi:hypothetical protein